MVSGYKSAEEKDSFPETSGNRYAIFVVFGDNQPYAIGISCLHMKKIFTLLFLSLSASALAQGTQPLPNANVHAKLDVSNINPIIHSGGSAFTDYTIHAPGVPAFEVPRGSNRFTIFSSGLWLGGKDQQNNLYVAAQTFGRGGGYWPGPVGLIQDQQHSVKYDKVWKVSQQEIEAHQTYYINPYYVIPDAILTWPGNGNLANGEAKNLAPFIDVNQDGIYSPKLGDYPDIKGDQALYVIFNDKGNSKWPQSPAMNMEVHAMHFGFNDPNNGPVYNSVFSEFRIINRGTIDFNNFYVGLWTDLDIGGMNDDFIGCDTTTNRYFGYNGDNFDEGIYFFDNGGYGANPPVQSITLLNQQLNQFMYYNNDGHRINGDPKIASDFYNYLRGRWKDETFLTYGGDGTNQQNPKVSFMFPGDPITGLGWSEVNNMVAQPNIPADGRGLGSFGPFNFAPGQEITFTTASTFSRGSSNMNSVSLAQKDAQAVKHFFDTGQLKPKPTTNPSHTELVLYPNPASDILQLKLPTTSLYKPTNILITDATGREVLKTATVPTQANLNLDIQKLLKGVYQVSVTSENQILTSRLVKM